MSDKIAEIRARHDAVDNVLRGSAQMHDDRGYLLAEVDRLREVIRIIRARCVELDDSDAVSEALDISSAALGEP